MTVPEPGSDTGPERCCPLRLSREPCGPLRPRPGAPLYRRRDRCARGLDQSRAFRTLQVALRRKQRGTQHPLRPPPPPPLFPPAGSSGSIKRGVPGERGGLDAPAWEVCQIGALHPVSSPLSPQLEICKYVVLVGEGKLSRGFKDPRRHPTGAGQQ